jgi:peptidoglycan hydrolase-like protein with peptidoglycan-binding domain
MSRSRITRRLRFPALAIGAAATGLAVIAATGGSASAATGIPNIGYGSRGAGVACVQEALVYASILGAIPKADAPTVDGVFGLQTKNAIKEFQAFSRIHVDGIVGASTGLMLINDEYINGWVDWVNMCLPYIPTPVGTTFT